jgi:hypothetical protein
MYSKSALYKMCTMSINANENSLGYELSALSKAVDL